MKAFVARIVLCCLLACLGSGVHAAAPTDAPAASGDAQQVLVMLHLPAAHYRPGDSYGGSYTDRQGHGARRRVASAIAHDFGLTLLNDWAMPDLGVDCYVMAVPAGRSASDVAAAIARDPRAEWVQPMNTFHALDGDSSLKSLQPGVRQWHLDTLHSASTGRGVRVAIIDSGVDATHPDLTGRVGVEENFVDATPFAAEAHGTAVAGIIGARAAVDARMVGVAPQAGLLALRACWETPAQTLCNSFSLAKALQFAIGHDAQVINLSLAGPDDPLLSRLIDIALARGCTVVGAVDPRLPAGGFPASHAGVLAVADADARVAPAAADAHTVFAPGDDVLSAAPGARWNLVSGSSFAAAHVAGMVALVRELAPASTMRDAASWARLPAGSSDGPAGSIDACATLRRSARSLQCPASDLASQSTRATW